MSRFWMPAAGVSVFFEAEDGIRVLTVTGVQTCALPIFEPATRYGAVSFTGATLGVNDVMTFTIGEPGTAWLEDKVAFTGTSETAVVPEPATFAIDRKSVV